MTESAKHFDKDHDTRIVRLETSMATLAETTNNIQKSQDAMAVRMDVGFQKQEEFQRTAGRWNLGQVAAVITTTFVLIGAFGSPHIDRIDSNRQEHLAFKRDIQDTVADLLKVDREIDRTVSSVNARQNTQLEVLPDLQKRLLTVEKNLAKWSAATDMMCRQMSETDH